MKGDPQYAERFRARARRQKRQRKYGISEEVYLQMVKDQYGKCLICSRKRKLCVDHNHETGAVRGLLCLPCNRGIGLLGDDPVLLKRAINYLKEN